jgi:hypothetical protein
LTSNEIVTLLKDIVLAGAAITGSVVAVKGLGTWRRQLKGQTEYDLSRRILISLYKYRDAISGVRHPAMWNYEIPSPPEEEAKKMSQEKLRFYGTSKAYGARFDKVQAQKSSLHADLLEGEALWGDELKDLFKPVFALEHELLISIHYYIELINPDTGDASKEAIRKITQGNRDIMYDDLSEAGDEYKKDLIAAIEGIERYLKPKLSHAKG